MFVIEYSGCSQRAWLAGGSYLTEVELTFTILGARRFESLDEARVEMQRLQLDDGDWQPKEQKT